MNTYLYYNYYIMTNQKKYMHFHNETDLPIMVNSWVDGSYTMQCLRVGPRDKLIVHSSVGEWQLNAMFSNRDDIKIWSDNAKMKNVILVGKFSSNPCAVGNYSWLEYEGIYDCVYSKLEDPLEKIKGLMTFSLK
jgi:hypothetical protein